VKAAADIILNCKGGEGCLEQVLSHLTAKDVKDSTNSY
jgi:hypothetical protein